LTKLKGNGQFHPRGWPEAGMRFAAFRESDAEIRPEQAITLSQLVTFPTRFFSKSTGQNAKNRAFLFAGETVF
jgi:hypothetical protein